jgi:hypothetical protein
MVRRNGKVKRGKEKKVDDMERRAKIGEKKTRTEMQKGRRKTH